MIIKLYRLLNILSFDVVAGAVVSALFFGELLAVQILPAGLIALALTVWIIYTLDHLYDACAIKKNAVSARHRFHQAHFKTLSIPVGAALAIDVVMVFFTRKPVLIWGLMLAIAVGTYLLIQRYIKALKELFVACLYTCGVLLPAISVTGITLSYLHILLFIQFMTVAFNNLLVFSWFDRDEDHANHQVSFVTTYGSAFSARCIYLLSVVNIAIGVYLLCSAFDSRAVILLLIMNISLMIIFIFHDKLRHHYAYRLLGDAVFLIPAFYFV